MPTDATLPFLRSLRFQTAIVFVMLAIGPAALVGGLLVDVNRDGVATSERQLQAAVLSEITTRVERHVLEARDDVSAVANALLLDARSESDRGAFLGVRSVLATRRHVRAVRLEVPSANVDTEIRVPGYVGVLPHTTEAMREEVASQGARFFRSALGQGVVVAPLTLGQGGAQGFVSGALDLEPLRRLLDDVAHARFGGSHVRIAVVDHALEAVATTGSQAAADARLAESPLWALLPATQAWDTHFALVGSFEEEGESMLGAVETAPRLGWGVALWRPRAEAYSSLQEMQRRTTLVGLGSLLLSLVLAWFLAGRLTAPLLEMVKHAQRIGARAWSSLHPLSRRTNELGQLAASLERMATDLEQSEQDIRREAQLRQDLSRFMNQKLVERIVRGDHSLSLGGQRVEVSVVFADVVGFTPLVEKLPPEQVVALLNELFSLLTEIVLRHGGIVDKFIGDGVMAIFGAPESLADHGSRALRGAEDMLHFVEAARSDWQQRYDTHIELGIGVSSGVCTVGNVGSNKRMEYTAIGDVVNVAARLETLAAPGQVLMTEATRRCAGDAFQYLDLGERQLPGRETPHSIFALAGAG